MSRASRHDMHVVLISPSRAERSALAALLREDGHEVVETASREEGIQLAATTQPDAIVADVLVPDQDGLALLEQLGPELSARVIFLCSRSDRRVHRPGFHCMTKPIDLGELQEELDRQDSRSTARCA